MQSITQDSLPDYKYISCLYASVADMNEFMTIIRTYTTNTLFRYLPEMGLHAVLKSNHIDISLLNCTPKVPSLTNERMRLYLNSHLIGVGQTKQDATSNAFSNMVTHLNAPTTFKLVNK